jgi:hypothetical protein
VIFAGHKFSKTAKHYYLRSKIRMGDFILIKYKIYTKSLFYSTLCFAVSLLSVSIYMDLILCVWPFVQVRVTLLTTLKPALGRSLNEQNLHWAAEPTH